MNNEPWPLNDDAARGGAAQVLAGGLREVTSWVTWRMKASRFLSGSSVNTLPTSMSSIRSTRKLRKSCRHSHQDAIDQVFPQNASANGRTVRSDFFPSPSVYRNCTRNLERR